MRLAAAADPPRATPTARATDYASAIDGFRDKFAPCVVEQRDVEGAGLTMMRGFHDVGDCSVPATPDLVVAVVDRHVTSVLIDHGAGRFHAPIAPGRVLVVPPHSRTSIDSHGHHEFSAIALPWAMLRQLVPEDELPADGDFGALHASLPLDRAVHRTLHATWRHASGGAEVNGLLLGGLVLQLVGELLLLRARLERRAGAGPRAAGGLSAAQLRRALECMADQLDRRVALREVAASVHLSPFHFCRAFKQSIGVSPAQWHAAQRLDRAARLLADTRLPILQIALECGFATQSGFATAFRAHTGNTPTEWRQAHRGDAPRIDPP